MERITSVLIADDHALYREGLHEIIDRWDDFSVIGEACNGREAVEFCREWHPDLVLMDVKMPVMDGLSALREIREQFPGIVVVMLSVCDDEDNVISAIRLGARGYVLKNCYSRQLHHRLRGVIDGGCTLSEEAAACCMDYIRKSEFQSTRSHREGVAPAGLTDHERKLLNLIAVGSSNKEIGERLFISESTVKKQISFMLSKLGLENRVQAAVFALRTGIAD